MTAQRSVVVTDVTTPHRFLAALTSVHRTVARDVEIVGVSAAFPKLPPQLERRVRKVRVARGGTVADAVAAEAVRPVQVVVLTSDTRVSGDWLDQLERLTSPTPYCVGLVGGDEPRVLVFGERVRTTQAQDVHLPDVSGISWGAGAAPSGSVRAPQGGAAWAQAGPVTVTAALIVKDEEAVLAQCLDAVRPEVDEVVVYDTGSTDGTVALARAHGARVVEGHWDDDFAAARNRLLEHVSTEWVLSLDADEVLETEPGALRQRLAGERADLLLVPVVSTSWSAADDGDEHRPARVFRRERAVWTDPLHEVLVPRDGGPDLVLAHLPAPVRLLHSGYQADRMADKDKHARNLDIARAQVDALTVASADVVAARAWANYGRALVSAGRREEGLEALNHLLDLRGNRSEMVQAARSAVLVALATSRLETVDRWLEIAQQHGETTGRLATWRAQVLLHHGDLDGAQAELDLARAGTDVDPWGQPFDHDDLAPVRASLLSRQGRHAAALEVLVDVLARRQEAVPLPSLLQAAVNAGQPLGDLAAIGGPQFLARSLRDAMHLPPQAADQWLDAVYRTDPQPGVLVAGAVVAVGLPMDALLKWSLRVREAGAVDLCPLRAIGYDVERPAAERCLALAVLGDVLGEQDALAQFDGVAAGVPDDETGPLLAALATYAPGLAVEPAPPGGDRLMTTPAPAPGAPADDAAERLRVVLEIRDLDAAGSQVVVTAAVQLFGPADPVDVVLHLAQDGEPSAEQAQTVLAWCVAAVPSTDELPDVVLVSREEAQGAPAAVTLVAPADLADAARSVALLTAAAQSVWETTVQEQAAIDQPATPSEAPLSATAASRAGAAIERAAAQLAVARRDVRSAVEIASGRRRPTVVGLFQHISYWAAVEDVYRELAARPEIDFVPVALDSAVDRRSGDVAGFLAGQGLEPQTARWLVEHLGEVDAVLLENPYDETRPWQLTVPALARRGVRLVGLPYGNNAIDGDFMTRLLWDMPLHRLAWRYYLPSPSQRALFAEHCAAGDEPVRVLGNAKHDRLVASADRTAGRTASDLAATWRELAGERPVVVWNPHFRTSPGGWSTFPRYARQLTAYAEEHQDVVVVVRPHFRLFAELRGGGLSRLERDLRAAAAALPNLVLDESPDYRDALAVADAMVSDLSSLASEFLVTGRPLLYLHRADGPGPSSEGGYLDAAARAESWADVERFLDDVRARRDPHAAARREVVSRAFPFLDGGCARRIADDLVHGLLDDLAVVADPADGAVAGPAQRPGVVHGGRASRFSTPTPAALATARGRSLRNEVVLTCFDGHAIGGNPLAVADELQRVGHSARRWWVVDRPDAVVPEGCEPLVAGTPEHHEALSRARWVVDNDATAPWFERRPQQTVLQTWHGTPLKRLRFDLHELSPRSPETLRLIEHQARQWTHVVSANPLTSQVMRRGFRFEGELLETGYPRNDVLADPARLARTRHDVRARLGVRDDQLVVLYAPTWRDDAVLDEVGGAVLADQPTLDWRGLRSVLGERAVLWLRAHRFVAQTSSLLGGAGVVDLSHYPDMADLLAAADVLVTDYSSSFFDFALTGRPMVFYAPDLEHYRTGLRGHYFRMEDVVPGPVLADAHRVTEALATLDSWRDRVAPTYAQFVRSFAPWDDGKAAQRVVEAVFS